MLESVRDCFDEIHLTDTGSTDGSLELIQSWLKSGDNPAKTKIILHHFTWVNDFAKARNYAFSHPKTDYIMWLDLDDVLHEREAFIGWRDNVLALGEFWLASYHYSLTPEGKPLCSFARERVVKRELCFTWNYPVHEGMLPKSPKQRDIVVQYATTWAVNHLRSSEDLLADRSRNLEIMKGHKETSSRLRYYYGKELFENNKILEGFNELISAIAQPDLELHDRIMGVQYAALAAMRLNEFEKAIQLAMTGIQLAPTRAELFVIAADSYMRMNRPREAVPLYHAASACPTQNQAIMHGAIFSIEEAYTHYPLNQLARIYANFGDMEKAKDYSKRALVYGDHSDSLACARDIESICTKVGSMTASHARLETQDIVITCPPGGLYEWDGDTYRTQGIGGSETACVEIAEWLHKITGRNVTVFNKRTTTKTVNGVTYQPTPDVAEYFRDHKPALHIAWRHVTKLSNDPYYVWCHDLAAPGIESKDKQFKILALSEFHKRYLQHMYAVDADKILVTRNGIRPERFTHSKSVAKQYGKVIYSSSADRGLARTIAVMDQVVQIEPAATLHVYYGFDNMYKMGMGAQADDLKRLMHSRKYVTYHGNLAQEALTREFESACVWLYPTNFLETFCITALEAVCSHVYPVVRKWGGLQDTLAVHANNGGADLIDSDCVTPEQINLYATQVVYALKNKMWENVCAKPAAYSWESVAREWAQSLLEEKCLPQTTRIASTIRQ